MKRLILILSVITLASCTTVNVTKVSNPKAVTVEVLEQPMEQALVVEFEGTLYVFDSDKNLMYEIPPREDVDSNAIFLFIVIILSIIGLFWNP
jgi:hypothetical protein